LEVTKSGAAGQFWLKKRKKAQTGFVNSEKNVIFASLFAKILG
jgi:hypothetical protein